jgi:3-oxoadipate enol-lactonase
MDRRDYIMRMIFVIALPVLVAGTAACASRQPVPTVAGTTPGGLYYEVTGAGEPVVLIHGFSLDRRMWEPQLARLAERHRVVRYDLRGHGESAAIAGPYAGTDDLRELLDHLGLRSATLVGLSAGAQIALDFALSHPDRADRLVLAGPGVSGYVPRGSWDWMAGVMEAVRAGDAARAAARWAETPLMAIPGRPAADSLMRRMVTHNARIWSYASNPERVLDPPAIGRLGEIRVPTLIVVGADDLPDILRVAELLRDGIAGSTRVVVPGAGHLVNLADPSTFNDAVAAFLGSPRP